MQAVRTRAHVNHLDIDDDTTSTVVIPEGHVAVLNRNEDMFAFAIGNGETTVDELPSFLSSGGTENPDDF